MYLHDINCGNPFRLRHSAVIWKQIKIRDINFSLHIFNTEGVHTEIH